MLALPVRVGVLRMSTGVFIGLCATYYILVAILLWRYPR
jgi:hypothetical protein